jgi:hypothetical protein
MGEAKRREEKMEEDVKKVEEGLKEDAEPETFIAKMEIIMVRNGNIGIRGPVRNKALCKALLAGAAEVLDEQKSNIIPANFIPKIQGRG